MNTLRLGGFNRHLTLRRISKPPGIVKNDEPCVREYDQWSNGTSVSEHTVQWTLLDRRLHSKRPTHVPLLTKRYS
ncbi:hypothetical protein TNCV_2594641 [Trichonephila clavipes]|nr:hypothetical protein TNCV_2594641 [Trichonephila clavipes]